MAKSWLDENRSSWDYINKVANSRKASFAEALHGGWPALPIEVVGWLDISDGERVVQLMCNDGRELLYLALNYNIDALGFDFSGSAIDFACSISREMGRNTKFLEQGAVEALTELAKSPCDVIFTTLGTLWWVSDLHEWFRLISEALKPGGRYVIWDFHPITHCFDNRQLLYRDYPFKNLALKHRSGVTDYTFAMEDYDLAARKEGDDFDSCNPFPATDFRWSLADIVNAAITNPKLALRRLEEDQFLWAERYFEWLSRKKLLRFEAKAGFKNIPVGLRMDLRRI